MRSQPSFRRCPRLAVAGRTDTGVHALGQRRHRRRRGRARAGARRLNASNAALPDDVAVVAAGGGRRRLRCAPLGPFAELPLPHLATARAVAVRASSLVVVPDDRSTKSVSPTRPTSCVGRHDFRAFTPTETQHTVFVRERLPRRSGIGAATRSSSRSRPTASCGTWCARSSARCSSARRSESRRSSRDATAARPGSTVPPWGLYLERVEY